MAERLGLSKSDIRKAIPALDSSARSEGNKVPLKDNPLQTTINFILYTLLLFSPLIYFPHIQDFSNLPKIIFIQFASCLLLLFWLLQTCYRSNKLVLIRHPLMIPLGLWFFWSGISIFWSTDRFAGIVLWLHWFICSFCFLVIVNSTTEIKQLDWIALFSSLGAAFIALIGIFQFTLGLDVIPQGAIPGSTFSNRNIAVQFIVMIWPLALLQLLLAKDRRKYWFFTFIHSLMVIYLLYSRTRAGWVAVSFSLLMMILFLLVSGFWRDMRLFMPREKTIVFIGSIIFIAGMAAIPQYTPSAKDTSPPQGKTPARATASDPAPVKSYKEALTSFSLYEKGSAHVSTTRARLVLWDNSLRIIRDNPLFGVGLANWYIHYPMYNRAAQTDSIFSTQSQPDFAHNDLLQLMTETSIVGFILYAGIFVIIFWRSLSAFRATKDIGLKLRLICGMISIIAFMMNSLFTFPIRMAIPPLFLMVILGLLVSLDLHTTKETSRLVVPMNNYSCYTLIAVFCLFVISLTAFNFRMILADRHYLKSRYFNRIKDWQPAKTEAQKAISYIPWRHMLWFELGRATDHLGLEDNAIEAYMNALKIHPNHLNSLLNLGYEYLKKKDFEQAIHPTRRALEIKPDLDKALFNMGKINEGKNQIKEAALNYQKSIKVNPTYAAAYFRLGLISLKENRLIAAQQQFEKALELKPGVSGVHFYLGIIYGQMNENQAAVAEFKKEIEINPRSAETFNNLGLISAKEEKWNEAVSLYKKAIGINPNLGAAQMNIAIAYYMTGDYSSSWKHSRIGEKLGLPQAKVLIRRLNMVSKEPDY